MDVVNTEYRKTCKGILMLKKSVSIIEDARCLVRGSLIKAFPHIDVTRKMVLFL